MQAQDRAHRIGQTRTVRVFRFITEGSIEERVAQRAEKKLYLDAVVNTHFKEGSFSPNAEKIIEKSKKTVDRNESKKGNKNEKKSEKEQKIGKKKLLSMLTFGAERVFSSKGKSVSDEDVDLILGLSKGVKAKAKRTSKLAFDSARNVASFDVRANTLAITRFRGEVVASRHCDAENAIERIAEEWAEANGRAAQIAAPGSAGGGDALRRVDVKYKRFFGHESVCHAWFLG